MKYVFEKSVENGSFANNCKHCKKKEDTDSFINFFVGGRAHIPHLKRVYYL